MLMAEWGWLGALALSAFTSATLLPGNSELAFAAALHYQPQLWVWAWLVAAVANSAGGALTVWLGRRLPAQPKHRWLQRSLALAQRFGPASLLLSWVPLLGDALCGLAGWLRWPWGRVLCYLSLGKIARYGVIVYWLV
ncbi:YqaA family protein [Chitinibacter tainanensis]|uniref:YqaA family protein n=1 Tax=Chitinibacter tainanensis TaxID=230667 RepID=UPI0004167A2C|nr:DedA family protein [Chitinibacter tainanensis]